jgi:hypothetical protein
MTPRAWYGSTERLHNRYVPIPFLVLVELNRFAVGKNELPLGC